MTQPRVLHVFKYFRPRFTGEGVFVERLAPIFASLRPDVRHDVLVTATPRPEAALTLAGLDRVEYLADGPAGATPAKIAGWLARHGRQYDVIHHHTHVDRTFLGALALKLQGRRQVLSATLDDSIAGLLATYRPLLRPLALHLFGLIDLFVAISPKLLAENRRLAPARKAHLVPMGVPLPSGRRDKSAARARLGLVENATVLVSVGGICPRKDQLFLLEQLPALAAVAPEVVLLLVGPTLDADYRRQLDEIVAARGLERHVRFAGHAERPWPFYEAADVFVFASREEGFGTVMIEAMTHGLPVVARRLPGVNDTFIADGRTGLLFDGADDFQRLLGGLLADPAGRQHLGSCAEAYARARFDIRATAAEYLSLYGYPASGP